MAYDENFFTPVDESDLTAFQPEAQGNETSSVDQSFFTPVSPDELDKFSSDQSSDALRERLKFNLQNDYAPDQGSLTDETLLGFGQGLSRLAGAAGGLSRFV